MSSIIRLADIRDAATMIEWYGPLIEETAISFETRPLTLEELEDRLRRISVKYPWLVCEIDEALAGFSYAGPHRKRPGYLWSVETSICVSAAFRRRRVGQGLYKSLLALLEVQGFQMAYAGITIPNAGSVALHESVGFEPVGVYRAAGYKLGAWHDVGWWQIRIGDALRKDPTPPLTTDAARESLRWPEALAVGEAYLRS